tara:strand:- start:265 stop:732 length:468 start_codon:yes stop_codon:yes gene_type:complete
VRAQDVSIRPVPMDIVFLDMDGDGQDEMSIRSEINTEAFGPSIVLSFLKTMTNGQKQPMFFETYGNLFDKSLTLPMGGACRQGEAYFLREGDDFSILVARKESSDEAAPVTLSFYVSKHNENPNEATPEWVLVRTGERITEEAYCDVRDAVDAVF